MLCPLTTSFSSYYSVSKTRSFDIPSLTLYSVLIIIILSDYYTNNMGIALQLILPLILPQSTITKFHHHIYHIYAHLQCINTYKATIQERKEKYKNTNKKNNQYIIQSGIC